MTRRNWTPRLPISSNSRQHNTDSRVRERIVVKWPVPLLSMTALIAGHAAFAAATDPADASAAAAPEAAVEHAVVKDNLQSTVKAEEARLASIPGGTSLIAADVFEKGRVGTTSDILAFQPGVYAQTAQGSDGLKI